uniref:Serine aminopeptidase S33 domain-containing protein n=1 Tax=Hyaloperonospora arabidopsidis (strain Emoy2) TaxID=559515 RepID=M4BKJ7_HYAAE
MPNCKKVSPSSGRAHRPHVPIRDALPMSVIVEEPASMRESRLEEQFKHPDDIKPSNGSFLDALQERPRDSPEQNGVHQPAPKSPVHRSEVVPTIESVVTATKTLQISPHSPHTDEDATRAWTSLESRSSHREPLSPRNERDVRNDRYSTHQGRLDPESALRVQSRKSSSCKENEEIEQLALQGRPIRRRTDHYESSTTRPKAFSDPPLAPRRSERCPSPKASYSSRKHNARIRSKSSTKMNPILSPQVYGHDRRAEPDLHQAVRPRTTSRDSSRSNSPPLSTGVQGKRMLPPFRSPSRLTDDDSLRSQTLSGQVSGCSDQNELMDGRQASYYAEAPKVDRVKSPPPSPTLLSDTEDRRTRSIRELSPSAREHSTQYLKSASRHNDTEQHQVRSCRQSRLPATQSSESPLPTNSAKDKLQVSPRLYGGSRERSRLLQSFLPCRSPIKVSSEETVPRSTSTATLSPSPSTPSPRMSVPASPLRLRHYEGRFMNRRRQTLFYFSLFPPERMPLRGVVLCLHRLGDHCRRNVNLYERLCREGFGVITYDLLNHGVSDLDEHKTRAHIGDFTHLVEDTNDFITFAKRSIYTDALRYWRKCHYRHQEGDPDNAPAPELPLIIAGTCFGSIVGIHTVLSGQHKFHAAVWSSPTFGLVWNPLLWAESKLAKPLAAMMPKAKVVPAVQHELLSRDPNFLRRFKADPLTYVGMMTARTGHEILQAVVRLQEDARVMDPRSTFCAVPTLFLGGSLDGISDQQAAIKFFGTMGNFDKEFKLFDGLYHLVCEEPEKENVFRYLAKWLRRRFPSETR